MCSTHWLKKAGKAFIEKIPPSHYLQFGADFCLKSLRKNNFFQPIDSGWMKKNRAGKNGQCSINISSLSP